MNSARHSLPWRFQRHFLSVISTYRTYPFVGTCLWQPPTWTAACPPGGCAPHWSLPPLELRQLPRVPEGSVLAWMLAALALQEPGGMGRHNVSNCIAWGTYIVEAPSYEYQSELGLKLLRLQMDDPAATELTGWWLMLVVWHVHTIYLRSSTSSRWESLSSAASSATASSSMEKNWIWSTHDPCLAMFIHFNSISNPPVYLLCSGLIISCLMCQQPSSLQRLQSPYSQVVLLAGEAQPGLSENESSRVEFNIA